MHVCICVLVNVKAHGDREEGSNGRVSCDATDRSESGAGEEIQRRRIYIYICIWLTLNDKGGHNKRQEEVICIADKLSRVQSAGEH